MKGEEFAYQEDYVSNNHVVFKLKHAEHMHEKSKPTYILDANEEILTTSSNDYTKHLTAGDLVQVSFVPYPWSYNEVNSISLSPKSFKIIKKKFVPNTVIQTYNATPIFESYKQNSPGKVSKKGGIIPRFSTTNLGF